MSRAVQLGALPTFGELQNLLLHYGRFDRMRLHYAERFGYGLPCREVVEAIANCGPLLEVGAGNGFWTYCLRRKGIDVIATDPKEAGMYNRGQWIRDLVEVDAIAAMNRFPGRNILLVWPHFESLWAVDVAQSMKAGQLLCYVGEGAFGCCAPNIFFLELARSGFKMIYSHPSPSWVTTQDHLFIYQK